jgi:hypothetical protein
LCTVRFVLLARFACRYQANSQAAEDCRCRHRMHLGLQVGAALENDRIPQAAALGSILARMIEIVPAS